ncbi:hypothetical protein M440DRAFT_1185404 [Trichoderma longibrachiatum ATCC 18648]|uniref:Uncharacterized protein n=1 Tax=Trichoderma longibrachiatum ATCC 18648 TaxID=983965 RepID=A0A2T4C9E6_TRILO|nr:hypothetical protein M440DRAFT_1185404 [Trichoderma longibrachiatum ATCC 18648]
MSISHSLSGARPLQQQQGKGSRKSPAAASFQPTMIRRHPFAALDPRTHKYLEQRTLGPSPAQPSLLSPSLPASPQPRPSSVVSIKRPSGFCTSLRPLARAGRANVRHTYLPLSWPGHYKAPAPSAIHPISTSNTTTTITTLNHPPSSFAHNLPPDIAPTSGTRSPSSPTNDASLT